MVMSSNISASPCSTPTLTHEQCLQVNSERGYRKFEAFTSWGGQGKVDIDGDPSHVRAMADKVGITYSSLHLPPIMADDFDVTLQRAIKATQYAKAIGAPVVLYKASDRATYIKAAPAYLDATADMGVTPVLQNHAGSPISTLDDFREVIEGIRGSVGGGVGGDVCGGGMKTLLEVGHFHAVGVSWEQGYELLGDSIALVHIKDMVGSQSVPFGTGEVDLAGLFKHMAGVGYAGDYVVEMEVADTENTLQYLRDAIVYLKTLEGVRL